MASGLDFLSHFRQHSVQQFLLPHTQIFRQQEPVRDIYLLETGLVKMTHGERNGKETILDLRFAGSFLGATAALAHEPAPMTAATVTPCEVYRLSAPEFLRLAKNSEPFPQSLLELVSRQRNEQLNLRAQQSTLDARPRLIMLLLRLAKEFGIERKGQLYLALPIAKQDMAGMLGITPQRLSNILREIKAERVIAEERGWIILQNRQALRYEAWTDEKRETWSQL